MSDSTAALIGSQIQQANEHLDDLAKVQTRYAHEREKRLNENGMSQYIFPSDSKHLKDLVEDPWIERGTTINSPVSEGGHSKIVIIGAGYGGILNAVKLVKAGFDVKDILIIDSAGGFGGTWYYNRYPGLMCDIESYIYLPLLEETGYIPTRKYVSGEEIREYGESIASKYHLHARAMFQSSVKTATRNSSKNQWDLEVLQRPKGNGQREITIHSDFVIFAIGVLNGAKLPDIPGNEIYRGQMFHTAHWAYDITGGCPSEPKLTKLKDKKVAFVGTGATGVQAIPHLAKWSKELYVFQRTPSAIDVRNNCDTDMASWKTTIATKPGWQRERATNFNAFISKLDPKPEVDLVNDGWTTLQAHTTLTGGQVEVTMETVGEYIAQLHTADLPRSEKVRQRAAETVKDPAVAQRLQAWYPSWCKRPCFHDEYLPTFNEPNVKLVDTNGKGIDNLTSKGVVLGDKEYEVDVLIWGTGYSSPSGGSVAGRAGVEVTGEGGVSLDTVYREGRLDTLHGVVSRGFPNMFWTCHTQSGISGNYMNTLDINSSHIAYIMAEVNRRAGPKPIIQPTQEGQEAWGSKIMQGAFVFAGMAGCTPSYFNLEGEMDRMTREQQMVGARYGVWPKGQNDFISVVEKWQKDNQLQGLEIISGA